MTHSQTSDSAELPIACTLDAGASDDRLARWKALSERVRPTMRREADQIVVAYPASPAVRAELEALVAAERRCCTFADWQVLQDDDLVLLQITATPDGLDAIVGLVVAERAADGSLDAATKPA